MAKIEDPVATVNFEDQGVETDRIKSYSISSNYLTATDAFEFVLFDTDREKLRGLELQPIEFKLNGNQQLLGRIDVTEIGDDGSALTCRGRDYIADMVECNVDPTLKIKDGVSLSEAIREAAGPVGITQILDIGSFALRDVRSGRIVGAKPLPGFKESKTAEYKPNPGEGIYQFCNRMVARFGATIQPAVFRNAIQLTAPHYNLDPIYDIIVSDSEGKRQANNVISATATRDFSSMPTFALFTGRQPDLSARLQAAALGSAKREGPVPPSKTKKPRKNKKRQQMKTTSQTIDVEELAKQNVFGPEIMEALLAAVLGGRRKPADSRGEIKSGQLYRLLYHRDTDSRNQGQIDRAMRRAFFERFKETLVYSCKLRGHTDPVTGTLWAIDTIANVRDEIRGVNEPMWIASRTFRFSPGAGATTDLKLWRKGSLQL